MSDPKELVALVTGGSSDIGQAISLSLAKAGADVAIQYRSNQAAAESCLGQIRTLGRKGHAIQANLTALADIRTMVTSTVERLGRLDILVNGVGLAGLKCRFQDWTAEKWDLIVGAILKGTFFASQYAAVYMVQQGSGRIINISSTITRQASEGMTPYVAAKGGVEAMTVALAVELAPHGITVNAVQPSIVPVMRNRERWQFYKQQVVPFIPAGRLCRPEDVASVVRFLASPEAGYVTGQIIAVDGGWSRRPAYPLP